MDYDYYVACTAALYTHTDLYGVKFDNQGLMKLSHFLLFPIYRKYYQSNPYVILQLII